MKSFHIDMSPSVHHCTSFKHGGINLAANLGILNLVKKFRASLCAWLIPSQTSIYSYPCSIQLQPEKCEKTVNIQHNKCHQLTLHFSIPVPTLQFFSIRHQNHLLFYIALHGISVHLCNGELLSHDFYFKMRSPT